MMPIWTLLISISLAVVGQILLKVGIIQVGALTLQKGDMLPMVIRVFSNPIILVGLVFYGASAFLWLVAISRLPLSFAYPMLAITFVLVPVLSYFLFGEQLTLMRFVAIGIIVIGILLFARG